MLLRGPYFSDPGDGRAKGYGEVEAARRYFFEYRPRNLTHLLRQRYAWMNKYLVDKNQIIHNKLCECFLFLVSGGMCVKTPTLQLPNWMLRTVVVIDSILVKMFPSVFAMGRQVVLQKSP